jgi:hypothetical protein
MRASAPAKKWRPSTSMSEEIAVCMAGEGVSSAQSSPMPSAARAGRARMKYCLIRSNSESIPRLYRTPDA